jgi:hypothetical protein
MGYHPNIAASILSSQHRHARKTRFKIGVVRKDCSTITKISTTWPRTNLASTSNSLTFPASPPRRLQAASFTSLASTAWS